MVLNFFASTIFAELSGISFNWQEFKSLKSVIAKFKTIPNDNLINSTTASTLKTGNIFLNNLSYKYPKQEKPLFDNLNLTFKEGKKYILTGDSAAGKTTILNIIGGLLRDYHGDISLANTDYCKISDHALHQKISYLQQDPYIFTASLKWNLTLGQNFSNVKLNWVIQQCGLESIINKLPQGLDTVLTDQGAQLSDGQKQRIAFACELLRDTPIYLLDEATSALDKNSGTKLEEIILTKKDKTVIMVTHHLRAEIERIADQVINLNDLKVKN